MNVKGGTRGVLAGNLKRRLDSQVLANIVIGEPGDGDVTVSCTIQGLSSVLNVFAGVSAVLMEDGGNGVPIAAEDWPANAGTLQIIPQTNFGDRPRGKLRPVFQDPTATDNENHPLPQDLPFSWNFPGECDEAVVEVVLNKAAWVGYGVGGIQIQLQVMVEYFGPWWDVEAVQLAMGQVSLSPPGKIERLFSS